MKQPRTRNHIAIAAYLRPGAGSHDGSKQRKNKRERTTTKQQLRKEYF